MRLNYRGKTITKIWREPDTFGGTLNYELGSFDGEEHRFDGSQANWALFLAAGVPSNLSTLAANQ